MVETTTLAEVYAEYAAQVGCETLSEAEKRQAYLNAVLDGKRVEPFASINDAVEAQRLVIEKPFQEFLSLTQEQRDDIIMDDMNSAIASAIRECLTRAVNSQT